MVLPFTQPKFIQVSIKFIFCPFPWPQDLLILIHQGCRQLCQHSQTYYTNIIQEYHTRSGDLFLAILDAMHENFVLTVHCEGKKVPERCILHITVNAESLISTFFFFLLFPWRPLQSTWTEKIWHFLDDFPGLWSRSRDECSALWNKIPKKG